MTGDHDLAYELFGSHRSDSQGLSQGMACMHTSHGHFIRNGDQFGAQIEGKLPQKLNP